MKSRNNYPKIFEKVFDNIWSILDNFVKRTVQRKQKQKLGSEDCNLFLSSMFSSKFRWQLNQTRIWIELYKVPPFKVLMKYKVRKTLFWKVLTKKTLKLNSLRLFFPRKTNFENLNGIYFLKNKTFFYKKKLQVLFFKS